MFYLQRSNTEIYRETELDDIISLYQRHVRPGTFLSQK